VSNKTFYWMLFTWAVVFLLAGLWLFAELFFSGKFLWAAVLSYFLGGQLYDIIGYWRNRP
jgi:hypothetical protein